MSGPVADGMLNNPLFGGSMAIHLPTDATDVSELRQVPDNQEVYVHPVTDQSIIIEILEYVDEPDEQALKTHYEDLASSNDAASAENSQILNVEQINLDELTFKECTGAYLLMAQQRVAKFKEDAKNTVYIFVGLYRLADFEADILVTFNSPINVNPESSSHADVPVSAQPWTLEQFRTSLRSLTLLDSSLFG